MPNPKSIIHRLRPREAALFFGPLALVFAAYGAGMAIVVTALWRRPDWKVVP